MHKAVQLRGRSPNDGKLLSGGVHNKNPVLRDTVNIISVHSNQFKTDPEIDITEDTYEAFTGQIKLLNENMYLNSNTCKLQAEKGREQRKLPMINAMIEGKDTTCLVDTGSTFSILSTNFYFGNQKPFLLNNCNVKLNAANGTEIDCWGMINSVIKLGGYKTTFDFIIANVHCNILGYNFLRENGLSFSYKGDQTYISIGQDETE